MSNKSLIITKDTKYVAHISGKDFNLKEKIIV